MQSGKKDLKTESLEGLKMLVSQVKAKGLSPDNRLKEYIKHFVNGGSYDTELCAELKKRKKEGKEETSEDNEKWLHRFLHTGKGVCQQFAQALSLICGIDEEITCYYTAAEVKIKDETESIGHAFNVVELINGEHSIVDISSMIHCEEDKKGIKGGYKSDAKNFAFVSLEQYMQNFAAEGNKVLPMLNEATGEPYYSVSYPHYPGNEAYYDLLNLPTSDIREGFEDLLFDPLPEQSKKVAAAVPKSGIPDR